MTAAAEARALTEAADDLVDGFGPGLSDPSYIEWLRERAAALTAEAAS